jgi:hypothetical protein
MDLVCGLGLVHKISTSISILVSGLCMLYHNFYCIFSCYLSLTKPGLGCLYSCSYTDTGCPAVKWVTENIRRMVRERALERWETKLENCKVTPQEIWPIAKSLTKKSEPKAPSAIHGPLGPLFYPIDKANAIADCLENQFTAHNLCDCDHRQQVEATVQALLATDDEGTPVKFRLERFRPCPSIVQSICKRCPRGTWNSSCPVRG